MFPIFTAGYEVVYDVLNHLVGRPSAFSGIPLYLGHFRSHVDERIRMKNPSVRGFFAPRKWTIFIQSAMAARLKGLPSFVREPCCDLRVIGGDGTAIGVTLANLDKVKPVWDPPGGLRPPVEHWGCMDRCAIGSKTSPATAGDNEAARCFSRSSTDPSNNLDSFANLRNMLDCFKDAMPEPIFKILEMWFSMDEDSDQRDPLRRILRACSFKDSVCGIIGHNMVPLLRVAIDLMCKPKPFSTTHDIDAWNSCMHEMKIHGKCTDIPVACEALKDEFFSSSQSRKYSILVFASLLEFLGK